MIGQSRVRSSETFRGHAAATGAPLEPAFSVAGPSEVERACALAAQAFDSFRCLELETRARFLEAIADRIMAIGDELLERAHIESGLPLARLKGERARTVGQLRLFASEVREGSWQGVRIDPALPERKPAARPDLRQRRIPLGPIVVFGASNFPLAFSVAGGDTAAAFAAGCPVIAKSHPAHPGTSELVAQAIAAAVRECELPEGVFSVLSSPSHALGAALAADARVKGIAFTGSRAGGLALLDIANRRPEPIPVYAEMSSINPVLLLPGALEARAESLGRDFVSSLTLGAGQFCTNPGIVIAIESAGLERFIDASVAALKQTTPALMLTPAIHAAFEQGIVALAAQEHVAVLARGAEGGAKYCGRAALFAIRAEDVLQQAHVTDEVFGASSVIVRCADERELLRVLDKLEGQLTATLHLEAQDEALAARIVPVLEGKAGRLIANAWPTGVEVSHAMVHGGPYPATSDSRTTSVGTLAIERFLRPVCYQDFPDALLPRELRSTAMGSAAHRWDGTQRLANAASDR